MALEDALREFTWRARELSAAERAPSSPSEACEMERRVFRRVRDLAYALERRAARGAGPPAPRTLARPRASAETAPRCPRYAALGPFPAPEGEALPSAAERARRDLRDPHDPPEDPLGRRRRLGVLLARLEDELPELTRHAEERWDQRRKAGQRFFLIHLQLRQKVREVLWTLEQLYGPRLDLRDLHFRWGDDERA